MFDLAVTWLCKGASGAGGVRVSDLALGQLWDRAVKRGTFEVSRNWLLSYICWMDQQKNFAASLERVEEGRKQEEIDSKLYAAKKKFFFKRTFKFDNAGMDFLYFQEET